MKESIKTQSLSFRLATGICDRILEESIKNSQSKTDFLKSVLEKFFKDKDADERPLNIQREVEVKTEKENAMTNLQILPKPQLNKVDDSRGWNLLCWLLLSLIGFVYLYFRKR
jgi:hypothetical protein